MSLGRFAGTFFGFAAGLPSNPVALAAPAAPPAGLGIDDGRGGRADLGLGLELWMGSAGQSRDQWPGRPHLKHPVGADFPAVSIFSDGDLRSGRRLSLIPSQFLWGISIEIFGVAT